MLLLLLHHRLVLEEKKIGDSECGRTMAKCPKEGAGAPPTRIMGQTGGVVVVVADG